MSEGYTAAMVMALRRAAEEHGRPNSFTCLELHQHYGGPAPMIAGRIGCSELSMSRVWSRLGGSQKWGSCPVYGRDTRRFYV